MLIKGIEIDNLINNALLPLDSRSAEVIRYRYGLENEKGKTLACLGEEYKLTRERIRQIEAAALVETRNAILNAEDARRFVETVHHYLNCIGGVRRSDMLVRDVKVLWGVARSEKLFSNQLHFLADILDDPYIIRSNSDWHRTWYNNETSLQTAKEIIRHLLETDKHDFEYFMKRVVKKFSLPEAMVLNYVSISKHFAIGPYGHLGAKHWMHVNPKTVRDKSYLVLWKAKKPLHFREIAQQVNNLKRVKRAHPATVHNELIKDPRFVLVGRGVYALKDDQ
ncbi:MAG: sigma factor-like helix-turn-helix DNA-binding protein [bacterium]